MSLFGFLGKKDKGKDKAVEKPAEVKKSATREFHPLRIDEVVQETANAISIYLEIPKVLQEEFDYKAGQYVTLKVPVDGNFVLRSYSISSSPTVDQYFRIGVKRKEGGALSPYLVSKMERGVVLEVFPPLGSFTPDLENDTQNYFLFAGGSGITPLLSIAKTILAVKEEATVVLVYANRSIEERMYRKELEKLDAKYKERLTIHDILDQPADDWTGLKGIYKERDYAVLLQTDYKEQLESSEHFICGPTGMMLAVEVGLNDFLKIPKSKIHVEYFDMAKQPVNEKKVIQSDSPQSSKSANGLIAAVTVNGQTHAVPVPEGKTVLDAALNKGIDAPFMCEAGVCASCRAKVTEGSVDMMECHSLSDKEIEEGYILTCQALATSDTLELNYDL